MRRFSVFCAFLIMLSAVVLASLRTQGDEPIESETNDFGDGIVVLTLFRASGLESKTSSGGALTNAKLVEMGGRYFIRGNVYVSPQAPEGHWSKGVDAAIAWEDVASFYIF